MHEVFTVTHVFDVLILVIGWSIQNELHHIRKSIDEAKEVANLAHKRIDEHLAHC